MPRYISANREKRVFDVPERFKVDRTDVNRHLAFAEGGRQVCIGLIPARRELIIAFEQLFKRLTPVWIGIDEDQIECVSSMILPRVKRLPILFESLD